MNLNLRKCKASKDRCLFSLCPLGRAKERSLASFYLRMMLSIN
jgi:hypothetical protein